MFKIFLQKCVKLCENCGVLVDAELSDWKKNRFYRLLAIDQGFLSFTDMKFGTLPVILPTLPKVHGTLSTLYSFSYMPLYKSHLQTCVRTHSSYKTVMNEFIDPIIFTLLISTVVDSCLASRYIVL